MNPLIHSFFTKALPLLVAYGVSLIASINGLFPAWIGKHKTGFALGLTLLGLAIVEVLNYFKTERDLAKLRRRLANAKFPQWLREAKIGNDVVKLRLNIMLIKGKLWPRWKIIYRRKMNRDADRNISFNLKQGWVSYLRANSDQENRVEILDLRTKGAKPVDRLGYLQKDLHMTLDQCADTYKIIAIATTLLIKNGKTFGALNVDASDDIGARYLQQSDVKNLIAELADYAEVLYGDDPEMEEDYGL